MVASRRPDVVTTVSEAVLNCFGALVRFAAFVCVNAPSIRCSYTRRFCRVAALLLRDTQQKQRTKLVA